MAKKAKKKVKKRADVKASTRVSGTLMNFKVANVKERNTLHARAEKLGFTTTAAYLREAAFNYKPKK